MTFLDFLPYGTLLLVLVSFGIWMYVKQVEVVHKPPGPNMGLIMLLLFFVLAVGFLAPVIMGFFNNPNNQTGTADDSTKVVSVILSWVGIGGGSLAMLAGGLRMLSAGKK